MKSTSNSINAISDKPKSYSPDTSLLKEEKGVSSFSEVKDIQDDLIALKNDISKLTQHVYKDGGAEIKKYAERKMEAVEDHMRSKPAQTLAIAFFSGIAVSLLLARR